MNTNVTEVGCYFIEERGAYLAARLHRVVDGLSKLFRNR